MTNEKPKIFHHRKLFDISQRTMAKRLGIHWVTLSRLENGHLEPSRDVAESIGAETGQSYGEVMDEFRRLRKRRAS